MLLLGSLDEVEVRRGGADTLSSSGLALSLNSDDPMTQQLLMQGSKSTSRQPKSF